MHLWNEYEGRIVADQFPLIKLLEPEGRSAFFSTKNGSDAPAVIRLIEAHFDEPEILARWNAVSKIDQSNLVKLGKFGQTTLDETALLYAVMEPSDATLADILKERPLSTKETMQVATSLIPAIEALHAQGLVHEHVEPRNIFAVGEAVKLRSDCVREVPEGADANEFKARDVHDLAIVLLQALTQQRKLHPGTTLPAPFHEIVTNGISGAWGLPQISSALAIAAPSKQPAPSSPVPAPAKAPAHTAPIPAPAASVPVQASRVAPVEDEPRRILPWTTIAAALILALFIGWHFLHKSPAAIPTLATIPSQATPSAKAAPAAQQTRRSPAVVSQNASPSRDSRTQWRVVAYTYNHEDQARQKAAEIAGRHAFLNPEVFSPRGHAPFLVTVGGAMSHNEALAFRKRARGAGLPRDTYAQNFPAKGR
jgi:eukaryotic-like serine/threonine-protein kinase